MPATFCLIGGCNGAGKTTLARELLPRLGLMRFLIPLADEWGVWDNRIPPACEIASHQTHTVSERRTLLTSCRHMEKHPVMPSDISAVVLEASRVATAKMLDYYKRMGIRVTPEMTLAPEPKRRRRKKPGEQA